LAAHFLDHFSSRSGKQGIAMTQEAIDALISYDWPGNVRQLRNEMERVVAYAYEGARISVEDLSPEVVHPRRPMAGSRAPLNGDRSYYAAASQSAYSTNGNGHRPKPLMPDGGGKLKDATAALERQLIAEALTRNRNNLSRTAIDLGLSRRGLRLKMGMLGIQREERV
jgi:DNA-binding NtrC family response regulator